MGSIETTEAWGIGKGWLISVTQGSFHLCWRQSKVQMKGKLYEACILGCNEFFKFNKCESI